MGARTLSVRINNPHGLADFLHRLLGDPPRAFGPIKQGGAHVVGTGRIGRAALADGFQEVVERPNQPFLYLAIAHPAGTVALLEVGHLVRVRVESVVILEHRGCTRPHRGRWGVGAGVCR